MSKGSRDRTADHTRARKSKLWKNMGPKKKPSHHHPETKNKEKGL